MTGESASVKYQYRDIVWLRGHLRRFYQENGRQFPWRESTNPYLILNTEILLQRTKAESVAKRWPLIRKYFSSPTHVLESSAKITSLIRELGLQKRVTWLLEIAAVVKERGMPTDYISLVRLPGVGPYAACATMAFAYGSNSGLVDGSIVRLLERFWGECDRTTVRSKVNYWTPVTRRVGGRKDVRHVFFGLLDLAALVCKSRSPECWKCPLQSRCLEGAKQGRADTTS